MGKFITMNCVIQSLVTIGIFYWCIPNIIKIFSCHELEILIKSCLLSINVLAIIFAFICIGVIYEDDDYRVQNPARYYERKYSRLQGEEKRKMIEHSMANHVNKLKYPIHWVVIWCTNVIIIGLYLTTKIYGWNLNLKDNFCPWMEIE